MKSEKNSIGIVVYENKKAADNKFNKPCKLLESKSICIQPYSFEKGRDQFEKNKDLWRLVCCAGIDMFPATHVNGEIEKIEEYPSKKEVYNRLSDT